MLMATNLHLNPPGSERDDDDLYSGFDEVAPALQTDDLEYDEGFQVILSLRWLWTSIVSNSNNKIWLPY